MDKTFLHMKEHELESQYEKCKNYLEKKMKNSASNPNSMVKPIPSKQPALMIYTSGTTGPPKGSLNY